MSEFANERASQPDQLRTETAPALPSPDPVDHTEQEVAKEPLAIRRIQKLRRKNSEAQPAEIATLLEQLFVRDFTLVGGAEAGVNHLIPGAIGAATRNSKVAGITRATSSIGVVQGISTYTQKTAQGVSTAAHVGSSQSIKTYLYGLALLHNLQVENADDAAERILGGDIHQLLRTLEQPIAHQPNQTGVSPLNVITAISQIGLRNPQMFLLVKSGEQLVRSGGSVVKSSKARKAFARQLIQQANETLGEIPTEFPPRLALFDEPEVDKAPETIEATPESDVSATSPEELERIASENTVSVKSARLAAKMFAKGSEKAGLFGFRKK